MVLDHPAALAHDACVTMNAGQQRNTGLTSRPAADEDCRDPIDDARLDARSTPTASSHSIANARKMAGAATCWACVRLLTRRSPLALQFFRIELSNGALL
jgi:hypothetical protein